MLFYREDSYNGGYRVWRDTWQGDQFEIVSADKFQALKAILDQHFPGMLVEADD